MVSFEYKSVGFIRLGAMGKPMAGHLANKLPKNTLIHIFDVVEAAADELCKEFPDRVVKGANAKVVAEKSVRIFDHELRKVRGTDCRLRTGYHYNNVTRRSTC